MMECYVYKIMDHVTDWVSVRLEAEMEERDAGESKTKGQDVDKMMRRLNFTIEEVDVLHVSSVSSPLCPNVILPCMVVEFKRVLCCGMSYSSL